MASKWKVEVLIYEIENAGTEEEQDELREEEIVITTEDADRAYDIKEEIREVHGDPDAQSIEVLEDRRDWLMNEACRIAEIVNKRTGK